MKIAAVQFKPIAGDVGANSARHCELIELAVSSGAKLAFFPELSITGYEPRQAASLAMWSDDPALDTFQALSDRLDVVVGIGAPLWVDDQVRVGMIWFSPKASRVSYTKQLLHADERPYFSPGGEQLVLEHGGLRFAPAICYESLQPRHSERAAFMGADVYLASIAKPARGILDAQRHYPEVARRHEMFVVAANCVGPCDDFVSVGSSAAWAPSGKLLAQLDSESEGALIIDTKSVTARCYEG